MSEREAALRFQQRKLQFHRWDQIGESVGKVYFRSKTYFPLSPPNFPINHKILAALPEIE